VSMPPGHTAAAHGSRRNGVSALELQRGAEVAQDCFDLARQYVGEARAYRAQRQRALARRRLMAASRMRLLGYYWKSGAAQSQPSVASLSVPLSFGQPHLTSRSDGIDHRVGRTEIPTRTVVRGPIWNKPLAAQRVFCDSGPIQILDKTAMSRSQAPSRGSQDTPHESGFYSVAMPQDTVSAW
jgi:hypothetical protein